MPIEIISRSIWAGIILTTTGSAVRHLSAARHINDCAMQPDINYSKTCLKWPLKNRQTKDLKTDASLMQVESIGECSLGAICKTALSDNGS